MSARKVTPSAAVAKKAPARKSTVKKAAAKGVEAELTKSVASSDIRELTDALTIRALAHPVRMALLEALTREGPLTATQAADLVDESPANCSFHFRTLQKYGYVEEVPGSTGRARPWRRKTLGQSIKNVNLQDNTEASIAAQTLATMAQSRAFEKLLQFIPTARTFPAEWQAEAFSMDWLVYVTPAELREINDAIYEVMAQYRHRTADLDQRPEDAMPVQLAAYGFPVPPTPSGN
jgi:predicted transcriptional regulator